VFLILILNTNYLSKKALIIDKIETKIKNNENVLHFYIIEKLSKSSFFDFYMYYLKNNINF